MSESAEVDIQEWLQKNTGWCEHFQAHITPTQCRENKRKARKMGDIEPRYKHCLNCPGIQKAGQTNNKSKEATKREVNQLIYCQKCSRKTKNHGRGLCARCYKEADLDGTLETYKLKNAETVEETQTTETTSSETSPVEKTNKRDPLAQAECIMIRAEKNAQIKGMKEYLKTPKIRLHNNLQRLELNSNVVSKFDLDKYEYAKFYKKRNNVYILLQKSGDSNTLRISWKDNKKKSSIVISCTKVAQKIGWVGGELFDAKATSRKDVIKLEERDKI